MGSGPGQAMLLLFPALFSCALAIRPMPLQSLDKYAPKGLYDSLSTDVSPARDDFTRSRTHTGSQQDNHFHDKQYTSTQVLKPWEQAEIDRVNLFRQQQGQQLCKNFLGQAVPCSGGLGGGFPIPIPGPVFPGGPGVEIVGPGQPGGEVCDSPGCVEAAHMLYQNMDQTVNPCEDFYKFSCGGFEKRIIIPDDRSSWSQFSEIDKTLQGQLRMILEAGPQPGEATVFGKARAVFHACMDQGRIEQIGLGPLLDNLKSMGGWPVLEGTSWDEKSFDWIDTTYKFRANSHSTDLLIDFSIVQDSRNSDWQVIDIDQASLGQAQTYLVKGMADRTVAAYYRYMVNVAMLLGAKRSDAEKEMRDALEFEMELAHASTPREMRRDANRMYNPMMIRDLSDYAPMVPWLTYINNILTPEILVVKDTERVILNEPGYLKNLTRIMARANKRTVANYMFFRAASSSIGYFTKAARKVQQEYSQELTGSTQEPPRWEECTGLVSGVFSSVIGHLYVKSHFKEDAKAAMDSMVKNIRKEMEHILARIQWMDPSTKQRAQKKLRDMKEYIGYPDELLQIPLLEDLYKDLRVSPATHFQNGIEIGKWSTAYVWSRMREKVDKTDWKRHDQPAIVNAFYSPIENSIQFPAGILQGNFFGTDRPRYMNYGGIGWVIGHEITHGFDDQGRQFDAEGNLKQWWEPATETNYLEKAQCIIWQYGNYTAQPIGINLNGVNTQGENIADNGGIKEAYMAYSRWAEMNPKEPQLPGFLKYSPKQMFWISAGNTWCSKYRAFALERRIRTGAHSPGPFRVKGPFSNTPQFAQDFNCPVGSGMNPVKKCEVW